MHILIQANTHATGRNWAQGLNTFWFPCICIAELAKEAADAKANADDAEKAAMAKYAEVVAARDAAVRCIKPLFCPSLVSPRRWPFLSGP